MSKPDEDIVVTLREWAQIPLYCHVPLNAAAEEIERLRSRVVRVPRSIEDSDGRVGLGIGLDRVKRLLDDAGVKWEVGDE